jgi:hypothetical protein
VSGDEFPQPRAVVDPYPFYAGSQIRDARNPPKTQEEVSLTQIKGTEMAARSNASFQTFD